MKTLTLGCAIVCALFVAGASGHAAGIDTSFDVPGATEVFPNAIDSTGNIAGYFATTLPAAATEKDTFGFVRASDGTITTFATAGKFPNTSETVVWGMNGLGTVVGEGLYAAPYHKGFVRGQDGTITVMDVAGSGTGNSSARAINTNGDVAGNWSVVSSPYSHGFILSGGVFTSFDAPNPSHNVATINTYAAAIDTDGNVAGTLTDSLLFPHIFLRNTRGRFNTFDIQGATSITVTGLNDNGLISGHYTAGGVEFAFTLKTSGKKVTTTITPPGAANTLANSLNFLGTVLGSYSDGTNYHGFQRDSSGNITTVDMGGGATDTVPLALNGNGVITGYYLSGGVAHGFIR